MDRHPTEREYDNAEGRLEVWRLVLRLLANEEFESRETVISHAMDHIQALERLLAARVGQA